MPGPPPPPPPGGPPPPPAFMPPPATKGGSNDRSALLQSIHKGAKLKKTVTVDKSGPYISGKTNQNTSNSNTSVGNAGSGARGASAVPSGPPVSNGFGLGGLFQDGIPKLKATGKNLGGVRGGPSTNSNTTNASTVAAKTPEILSQQQRSFAYTQKELKKQMASDNKNRGPPPPAPVRNFVVGQNNDDVSSASRTRNGTLNGFHNNLIAPNLVEPNSSSLYRKASSNVNLHSLDNTDSSHENSFQPRQSNNFGKPNLAPKPPSLNGKPKKLSLNGKPIVRTQSMKSPRSPSPQSGDSTVQNMPPKFGTVRNIPPGFAESLNNLHQKQRPPLNERPKAPPPSVPQQYNPSTPPPPSKLNMVKHPGHAPPPPPNINFVQASSNSAPPLPPHRTAPQIPSRIIPSIPTNLNANGNAPPPPPRNSSIKDAAAGRRTSSPTDFDVKFANRFHDVSEFPRPSHFKNTPKMYSTRPVGNKQQAPLPPNHIHLGNNRLWDSSTC